MHATNQIWQPGHYLAYLNYLQYQSCSLAKSTTDACRYTLGWANEINQSFNFN